MFPLVFASILSGAAAIKTSAGVEVNLDMWRRVRKDVEVVVHQDLSQKFLDVLGPNGDVWTEVLGATRATLAQAKRRVQFDFALHGFKAGERGSGAAQDCFVELSTPVGGVDERLGALFDLGKLRDVAFDRCVASPSDEALASEEKMCPALAPVAGMLQSAFAGGYEYFYESYRSVKKRLLVIVTDAVGSAKYELPHHFAAENFDTLSRITGGKLVNKPLVEKAGANLEGDYTLANHADLAEMIDRSGVIPVVLLAPTGDVEVDDAAAAWWSELFHDAFSMTPAESKIKATHSDYLIGQLQELTPAAIQQGFLGAIQRIASGDAKWPKDNLIAWNHLPKCGAAPTVW